MGERVKYLSCLRQNPSHLRPDERQRFELTWARIKEIAERRGVRKEARQGPGLRGPSSMRGELFQPREAVFHPRFQLRPCAAMLSGLGLVAEE